MRQPPEKSPTRRSICSLVKPRPASSLRAGIGGVAVGTVQLDVQAGDGGAVMARLGDSQLGLHATQLHVAVEDIVHRQAVEGVHLLAHVGDAPVGGHEAVARVGAELAAQQGEEAGFAGTVGADEADLLAGMQGQFGAFEQALRTTL